MPLSTSQFTPYGHPFTFNVGAGDTAVPLDNAVQAVTITNPSSSQILICDEPGAPAYAICQANGSITVQAGQGIYLRASINVSVMIAGLVPSISIGNALKAVAHDHLSGALANQTLTGKTGLTSYGWRNEYHAPNGLSNIQVVYTGAIKVANSQAETPIVKALPLQTYLEYPNGTFIPIRFNGQSSGTLQPSADLKTDVQECYVPAGATYGIHTYVTGMLIADVLPSNAYTLGLNFLGNQVANEGYVASPTIPQVIANTFDDLIFKPTAVLGQQLVSPRKSVLVIGNSIDACNGDCSQGWLNSPYGYSATQWIARAAFNNFPITNQAKPGSQIQQITEPLLTLDLLKNHDIVVLMSPVNDTTNGQTFAQLQANVLLLAAKAKANGCYFIAVTQFPPCTDGGQGVKAFVGGTGFSQSNNGYQLVTNAYNAWLRMNPVGIDAVFDVNAIADPTGIGFWKTYSPVYSGTGTVVNSGGSAVITDAGSPNFTVNQWSSPADGFGPYCVYFPATNDYYPIYSNATGAVTMSTIVGQYPSAPARTSVAYQIVEVPTVDGTHSGVRVITRVAQAFQSQFRGIIGF